MMKPYPGGACHLIPANQETDYWTSLLSPTPTPTNRSLARAYCDYFRGRVGHKFIETGNRAYNWTGMDAAHAAAAAVGKYFTISVSCGVNCSDRIKTLVAANRATDLVTVHTDATHTDTMPAMWNPVFQQQLGFFIQDLAAKYEGSSNVRGIYITGFMQAVEGHVASVDADIVTWENAALAAGYVDRGDGYGAKSVGYRDGVGIILDLWFNNFPTTPLYFTSSRPWGQTEAGTQDQNWVESTMATRYGDRRGLANSFLKARFTHTGAPPTPVTYGRTAQAIFSTVDDRYYADISPPWPAPPKPVEDLLIEGYLANRQAVEIYEYDFDGSGTGNFEINAEVIAAQRLFLLTLVPPGSGGDGGGESSGKTRQAARKGMLTR